MYVPRLGILLIILELTLYNTKYCVYQIQVVYMMIKHNATKMNDNEEKTESDIHNWPPATKYVCCGKGGGDTHKNT